MAAIGQPFSGRPKLSERAQRYLSKLKRIMPVPTEEVERTLQRQGLECFPAWLDFHERYAGYVEDLGLEKAVLGIVHARTQWFTPGTAEVRRSYHGDANWFARCAEAHPSFEYELGDTGFFFHRPEASSFEVYLERVAAKLEFLAQPGVKWCWPWLPSPPVPPDHDALAVPEASDKHCRLLMSERVYMVCETATGRIIESGTRG